MENKHENSETHSLSETHSPLKKTSGMDIFFAVVCTIFTSLGQLSWKFGVQKIDTAHLLTLLNIPFIFGFFFYGLGFLLMLQALKEGELTIVFPIVATSYVWVSMVSPLLFPGDQMNAWKWLGVGIILCSVVLLSTSAKKERKDKEVSHAP